MTSGKLKGIYDALDHGNYKNACKLCVAFLQKQPSHSLARALHAVALERCGRRDEAIQLCQETVTAGMACDANSPAVLDEIGLSTLQVVFRRCRHLDAILQMYEEAWNKQKEVEEYGVLVFMAAVHTNGFAKAQQVAMTLYNKFKKSHYLLWVTAAILLQVRAGAPSKALGLAAVMLTKAPVNLEALQGKAFNRGQLYLFFLHLGALQLQEKQAEALELLETCTPLLKLPSDISALKVQLLWEAGRRKEAVLEARQQLVANPGSWAHAQDYARLVFDLPLEGDAKSPCERLRNPPKVASMEDVETQTTGDEVWNALLLFRHLQQVQEQGGATGGGSGVNRVAFLAELELRRCALALSEGEPSAGQEDLQVLQVFVQRFSGRAHCFFDLKPHLCYVPAGCLGLRAVVFVGSTTTLGRGAEVGLSGAGGADIA
ncbi:unnamed protein product [Effrenium voratum]|nr:unnamed protein product [Effrenium voratum]